MRTPIAVATVALVLAGCGGSDESEANVVEIRGDEYAYVMPDQAAPGWSTMAFTNTGDELHEFAIVRLSEGKTLADVQEFLSDPASQQQPPPEWATIIAGVPTIAPGAEASLTQELEPGRHVLICFIEGPSGKPHFVDGMIRELEVVGEAKGEEPEADAVLELGEGLAAPEVEAGERTLELRNDGDEPSAVFLLSFEPGKTAEDVEAWEKAGAKGTPPARFLGGVIDVPAGTSVYYTLDLEADRKYTLFDDERGIELSFTPS